MSVKGRYNDSISGGSFGQRELQMEGAVNSGEEGTLGAPLLVPSPP